MNSHIPTTQFRKQNIANKIEVTMSSSQTSSPPALDDGSHQLTFGPCHSHAFLNSFITSMYICKQQMVFLRTFNPKINYTIIYVIFLHLRFPFSIVWEIQSLIPLALVKLFSIMCIFYFVSIPHQIYYLPLSRNHFLLQTQILIPLFILGYNSIPWLFH